MKIYYEAFTFEKLQMINKKAHFSARDRESKDPDRDLNHMKFRCQTTKSHLKKKTNRIRVQPEFTPAERSHEKELM
jgi:hypothetical protein